jgi:nucleotide-binding universal stress UspA family protein
MLRPIVVPVDRSAEADRAARVGARLARSAGAPLELLTVAPSGADPAGVQRDLDAWAARFAPLPCVLTAVTGDDTVGMLVEAFAERPGSLVVLGTSARGPLTELLLGSVSEAVLTRTDHPLLLVGPHVVDADIGPAFVSAVGSRGGQMLVPYVVDWIRTFGGDAWVVQVTEPKSLFDDEGAWRDCGQNGVLLRLAAELRDQHIDAQWDVLHGRRAPESLVDFTRSMGGGVIAVASERWAAPSQVHWTSTARELVHGSPFPVFVVPVHEALVAS